MKYISLFSGIEAVSYAWRDLFFEPLAFSEIDEWCSALLAKHYPNVSNLGDIRKVDFTGYAGECDLVVGGSACQSFSVAGKREGRRGQSGIMSEYIRAIQEIRPRWLIWENVPGALSVESGKAFEQLITELANLGYGLAWRVLGAQFFGVPQRRRRVFLVGYLGNPECAAEVLFEQESLRGDYQTSRNKREELTRSAQRGTGTSYTLQVRCGCSGGGKGALVQDEVSATLSTSNTQTLFQSYALAGNMIGRSVVNGGNGCGFQENLSYTLNTMDRHAVSYLPFDAGQVTSPTNGNNPQWGDPCHPITASGHVPNVIAFPWSAGGNGSGYSVSDGTTPTLLATSSGIPAFSKKENACYVVRRLTPQECERLQGFPDDYTLFEYKGKQSSDAKRYKALGNSMAVPVMQWIGERIQAVERTIA